MLRPTALGIKASVFFAVLVGAFYAAPYMNLFFLLLVFAAVVAGLGAWWTYRNLAGTTGAVLAPRPVPAGAPISVQVRLEARGLRRLLTCKVAVADATSTATRVAELEHEATLSGELAALPRGVHPVRWARVESTYPFGLLRGRRPLAAPPHVVVYPAPAELGGPRTRGEVLGRLGQPAAAGDDEQPGGVREFRPGDEPRRVHWKATARRGRLAVQEWDADGRAGIEVVLDRRCDAETLERSLSWLAALALWARAHDEVVAVASQDHVAAYGDEQRPWDELLAWLARVGPLPSEAPPPPGAAPHALRLPVALAGGTR